MVCTLSVISSNLWAYSRSGFYSYNNKKKTLTLCYIVSSVTLQYAQWSSPSLRSVLYHCQLHCPSCHSFPVFPGHQPNPCLKSIISSLMLHQKAGLGSQHHVSNCRIGEAMRRGGPCKPSHLQTLWCLHHSWRNMPPLTTCSPKSLHRTVHMSFFLCTEHHQRSQPFHCTVQYLMMNPAQIVEWLETRLWLLRQLPYP